jgi:hypothetical protein
MASSTKERGRIVQSGMGGFLNPPGHPEHTQSVETDLHRRPENRGGMSLSAAVACDWLDDATRAAARTILKTWEANKPALNNPEVQEWVRQVLGYFRGCYRNPEAGAEEWNAGKLTIDQKRNPLDKPEDHTGVNLIREFYPEFVPTAEQFGEAYWGKKPEAK